MGDGRNKWWRNIPKGYRQALISSSAEVLIDDATTPAEIVEIVRELARRAEWALHNGDMQECRSLVRDIRIATVPVPAAGALDALREKIGGRDDG